MGRKSYFKWTLAIVLGYVLWLFATTSTKSDHRRILAQHNSTTIHPNDSFVNTMKQLQENNTIVLALVDYGFLDMAVNFYETSLRPHKIKNYLFVGASKKTCTELCALNLHCYTYTEDISGHKASVYHSKDFIRKMNIRTDMILDALMHGTTVVHTDLDMIFIENPLTDLASRKGDLVTMSDKGSYNAGFLIVRPTKPAIGIYKSVRQITKASSHIDDQNALNKVIGKCQHLHPPCQVTALPTSMYLCGFTYFEKVNRMFAQDKPCPNCMVVHNNWIVSKEAKVYRFKEHLMWWNDHNEYYSSQSNKYVVFSNPLLTKNVKEQTKTEKESLENALAIGHILNRVVILARFHCFQTTAYLCPLNSLYSVSTFDSKFAGLYRESSFLDHPLVPKAVTSSRSATYVILGNQKNETASKSSTIVRSSGSSGATPSEIRGWFDQTGDRILVFEHLIGAFAGFGDEDLDIKNRIKAALSPSNYRQMMPKQKKRARKT